MRYLNFILTVIALVLAAGVLRAYMLERAVRDMRETVQAVAGSNQALINSNARLEAETVALKKEVASVKDSFSKR